MDQTYSWHSGSPVVSPKWGVPIALLPDESLSSFILRLSDAHGVASITLGEILWPKQRVWITDTDRMRLADLIGLSEVTGIASESLYKTTLSSIEPYISGRELSERRTMVIPWILTLGCRNRQREGGYCVCPGCLSEDKSPYLRIHWRLAWYTSCAKHRTLLISQCSNCLSPISPHLLSVDMHNISYCSCCMHDLRGMATEPCSQSALDIQALLDSVISNGHCVFGGRRWDSVALFGYLSFLESLSRRAMRIGTSPLKSVFEFLHVKLPSVSDDLKGLKFEKLPPDVRHKLMVGFMQLLRLPLDDFYACLIQCGITRQAFVGDCKVVPPYVDALVQKLPDNKLTCERSARHSGWNPLPKYLVMRKMKQLIKSFKRQKKVRNGTK